MEALVSGDAVTVDDVLFRRSFAGSAGEVTPELLGRAVAAWRVRWGRSVAEAEAETVRLEGLLDARAAVLAAWPGSDFPPRGGVAMVHPVR